MGRQHIDLFVSFFQLTVIVSFIHDHFMTLSMILSEAESNKIHFLAYNFLFHSLTSLHF